LNNERDFHADTCCFGANAHVLSFDLAQTASVIGFLPEMGKVNTPIANIAIAYDDAMTNTTYILIFNQVLYIIEMSHNLISPFQLRMNQVTINKAPIMTLRSNHQSQTIPYDAHSIVINDPELTIPLRLNRIMSFFTTRAPTQFELDHPEQFIQLEMTYNNPVWDPYSTKFAQYEDEC
jgi:hypothetical protein